MYAIRSYYANDYYRIDTTEPLPLKLQLLREFLPDAGTMPQGVAAAWLGRIENEARLLLDWNDPADVYAHCLCQPL